MNTAFSLPLFLEGVRDGLPIGEEAMNAFIARLEDIPSEQAAAFLAHAYHRTLSGDDTLHLMRAMRDSGQVLSWTGLDRPVADKHSTGGVGDKVTICLAPLLAAMGFAVPTITGRGLGFSGGTVDKLETIPGMRLDLDPARLMRQVFELGLAFAEQTAEIAPADRRLYALRDVTATVESLPLITASILSKKLAEGLTHLLLDVKLGSGAFMRTLERARALARMIVDSANAAGTATEALITSMDEPLGEVSGNSAEVSEAVAVLKGEAKDSAADTLALTLTFAANLARRAGIAKDGTEAWRRAEVALASGRPFDLFCRVVRAQGGDPSAFEKSFDVVSRAAHRHLVKAGRSGFVAAIEVKKLGQALLVAGAGRFQRGDRIDPAVTLIHPLKIGTAVRAGDTLCEIVANDAARLGTAVPLLNDAFMIAENPVVRPPLVREEVR